LGHEISIEFDINNNVTKEAVDLFCPQLILAPYLCSAIPDSIWRENLCLIVHPGIVGDRGPSALDWAILNDEPQWGATVLQAEAEMDAGPIWATENFPMRPTQKSSLYRNEVTEAVVKALRYAIERVIEHKTGTWQPTLLSSSQSNGKLRPYLKQSDRKIDWQSDNTNTILRKINSADGFPGVADMLFEQTCFLYDAREFPAKGVPGNAIGVFGNGLVRATIDGAVWIGHARRMDHIPPIKLPIALVFPEVKKLPILQGKNLDICYEEDGEVGYLHFNFYNGAMGVDECRRLLAEFNLAKQRPTRIIVLMGGAEFFSNGLNLNLIESADSPSEESWLNINAMDDLCLAIIETRSQLTISALQGNAGAGGAFLALAADYVWARTGVILNPHYMNMGNLYGSEYWTYLLPRRVGGEISKRIMLNRLPIGVKEARNIGFIDEYFGTDITEFVQQVKVRADFLANDDSFNQRVFDKLERRAKDESEKPLAQYRSEELTHMHRNFYGFDPSFHIARYHFVHKTLPSWTPRHLAKHRDVGWIKPQD
jgi:putative two-component system hydrogenase maturation factor HypX/HoxX